jgi:hypothetical protein
LESLIVLAFNGNNWSKTKRGEYFAEAMFVIDDSGSLWNQTVEMGKNKEIALQLREDEDFKNGYNDAFSYLGTLYNRLPSDDPDPIIQKAKELAPKLKEQNKALGILDGDDHVAVAIFMLTIHKYVKEKWD